MQVQRIMVLGHSYIWRLDEYVQVSDDPRVTRKFNLKGMDTDVYMYGVEGRKVYTMMRYDLHEIKAFQPHILLLQIGSNNLSDKKRPYTRLETGESKLEQAVVDIHNKFPSIKHKTVCGPFPRTMHYPNFPDFNNKNIQLLTQYLSVVIPSLPFASFWKHSELNYETAKLELYLPDHVHLNDTGNCRLYRNYRGAMINAIKGSRIN